MRFALNAFLVVVASTTFGRPQPDLATKAFRCSCAIPERLGFQFSVDEAAADATCSDERLELGRNFGMHTCF